MCLSGRKKKFQSHNPRIGHHDNGRDVTSHYSLYNGVLLISWTQTYTNMSVMNDHWKIIQWSFAYKLDAEHMGAL